jgi:hypothetical protein
MNAHAGMERAAAAMLRTLGGINASLLIPQPAAANGQTGLGLNVPLVNEVELEPVLLRTAGPKATGYGITLFAAIARCTLQKALSNAGAAGGDELATKQTLETSMLRVGETEYRIVSVMVKWLGGAQLLYELEIEE